ncbi:MAG TPA: glycosyltransferase family 4 protein [Acidimicrobiales bacterium]|nr:glycosyltransferase family 4 protein [Acidimicrobiales bacterium]
MTTTDISLALLLGPQLIAFREAGFEVAGASAPGPYVEELEQAGIRHFPLKNASRAMAPLRDLRALGELRSLFRSIRPNIVHTHNPKPGLYGRLAARAARVQVVVNTVHGLYAGPTDPVLKKAVVYSLERLAATCSDMELVQNPEDVPVLRRLGIPSRRLRLLGNGIDLGRFNPGALSLRDRARVRAEVGVGPDDVVCGVVGRLVWEKGCREVFDAAARLRRSHPAVRFVVIGPTDDEKRESVTPDDIARAEQEAGIIFLGLRRDMEQLYNAMDVFVLASYREGFPRSAMEAAAMSVPVIATDIRGCRQVVDHGATGLLVPARDAPALAQAVSQLADDPVLRTKMGVQGARKAKRHFDQRSVIETTLAVYDELLAQTR